MFHTMALDALCVATKLVSFFGCKNFFKIKVGK